MELDGRLTTKQKCRIHHLGLAQREVLVIQSIFRIEPKLNEQYVFGESTSEDPADILFVDADNPDSMTAWEEHARRYPAAVPIRVSSNPGQGTLFQLTLPLSAAIQGVLLVEAGGQPVAIPERNVSEIIVVDRDRIQTLQGQAAIIHQDTAIPVFDLHRLLYPARRQPAAAGDGELEVVLVSNGKWRMGLAVARVAGRQGIFVRDVHPEIANLAAVAGASVLGDGSVVIILDCDHLMTVAAGHAQSARALLEAS